MTEYGSQFIPEDEDELELSDTDLEEIKEETKPRLRAVPPLPPEQAEEPGIDLASLVSIPRKEERTPTPRPPSPDILQKAINDALIRMTMTRKQIDAMEVDLDAQGRFARWKLQRARARYPQLFARYDMEKQEYLNLLNRANRETQPDSMAGSALEDAWFKAGNRQDELHEEMRKEAEFEPGSPTQVMAPRADIYKDREPILNLQAAAHEFDFVTRLITVSRFPDLNLDPTGPIGKLKLRFAKRRDPALFEKYYRAKQKYEDSLAKADYYGLLSGKAGTSGRKMGRDYEPWKATSLKGVGE